MSKKKSLQETLFERFLETGETYEALGAEWGCSKSTAFRRICGDSPLTADAIDEVSKFLGVRVKVEKF